MNMKKLLLGTYKLTNIIDENQSGKKQANFNSDYSTIDNLQTIDQLIEEKKITNHFVYCWLAMKVIVNIYDTQTKM